MNDIIFYSTLDYQLKADNCVVRCAIKKHALCLKGQKLLPIDKILKHNQKFVEEKKYKKYASAKKPQKNSAVLSCMDTRLVELLPAALGYKNGDIVIIKNAGAMISHAFGSVMRSLLVAIYELGVTDIIVIGHYDCGVCGLDASNLLGKMLERGIGGDGIEAANCCGIDLKKWLKGFESVEASVTETVNIIKSHPLIPKDVGVQGFIIDPETGRLDNLLYYSGSKR